MNTSPCDLHELTNCAICNGTERRFQDSLRDRDFSWDSGVKGSTGPTIQAKFAGHCKSCGRRYDVDTTITHDRDADGWVAECCQ